MARFKEPTNNPTASQGTEASRPKRMRPGAPAAPSGSHNSSQIASSASAATSTTHAVGISASHIAATSAARANRRSASASHASHSNDSSSPAKGMVSYREKTHAKYQKSEAPKGVLLGIAVAALIVVVLIVVMSCGALNSSTSAVDEAATTQAQTSVSAGESVTYHDYTYALEQDTEGSWTLTVSGGAESTILYTFEGTPVSLVLAGGKLYAPENLEGNVWDIVCYMAGDGGSPYKMLNEDGSEKTGSVLLVSAALDGTNLVLTDDSGATTSIALS